MSYETPFAGLKVVDLSQGIAGPYCGMLLAQYGADVIKVEPVEGGDWARNLGIVYGDQCAFSIPGNLGKRSIALDLKPEAGKEILWRLIRGADVFLQGFRPGVIERLGFGYEAVSAREPRIIYVSVSGFGQRGPFAERPAMDPVLQAFTGLTLENKGEDGIPHRVPIIPIDMATAIYTFGAVSTALFARQSEPHGRHIEASLMQAAANLQVVRMMQSHLEGGDVRPSAPPTAVYRTADGFMSVTVVRPFEWKGFCAAIGREDLGNEEALQSQSGRHEATARLVPLLRAVMETRGNAEWAARFAEQRVMHEAINAYGDFLAHPHVRETGSVAWLAQPRLAEAVPMANIIGLPAFASGEGRAVAPGLGQHTEEILRAHGYGLDEIHALSEQGVIGV
jgi:crotonobetainyl-CoA:carnitine CoA-transferase CaiB-like acyl-CoA transferase